ncbi:MAG: hypothetical protein WD534_11095 [Phycisphaeraceae bacterium]
MRKQQCDERFSRETGPPTLVRSVTLDDGSRYIHRCPLDSFKQIAHAIEEAGREGTTIEQMVAAEDLPSSQVAVARAFLVERSLVEPAPRRRFRAASACLVEDALTEFHALPMDG